MLLFTPISYQRSLDIKMVELQKCAERRCRKIIKPTMEFSPKVKPGHGRVQAYRSHIHWKEGNSKSISNIIRTTLRKGIPNPYEMSLFSMNNALNFACAQKATPLRNGSSTTKETSE